MIDVGAWLGGACLVSGALAFIDGCAAASSLVVESCANCYLSSVCRPGTVPTLLPATTPHAAAAELEDDDVDLEPAPRRGLRSSGPAVLPLPGSVGASAGPGSRAGSEAPAPAAKPKPVGAAALLPNPKDIRREHT